MHLGAPADPHDDRSRGSTYPQQSTPGYRAPSWSVHSLETEDPQAASNQVRRRSSRGHAAAGQHRRAWSASSAASSDVSPRGCLTSFACVFVTCFSSVCGVFGVLLDRPALFRRTVYHPERTRARKVNRCKTLLLALVVPLVFLASFEYFRSVEETVHLVRPTNHERDASCTAMTRLTRVVEMNDAYPELRKEASKLTLFNEDMPTEEACRERVRQLMVESMSMVQVRYEHRAPYFEWAYESTPHCVARGQEPATPTLWEAPYLQSPLLCAMLEKQRYVAILNATVMERVIDYVEREGWGARSRNTTTMSWELFLDQWKQSNRSLWGDGNDYRMSLVTYIDTAVTVRFGSNEGPILRQPGQAWAERGYFVPRVASIQLPMPPDRTTHDSSFTVFFYAKDEDPMYDYDWFRRECDLLWPSSIFAMKRAETEFFHGRYENDTCADYSEYTAPFNCAVKRKRNSLFEAASLAFSVAVFGGRFLHFILRYVCCPQKIYRPQHVGADVLAADDQYHGLTNSTDSSYSRIDDSQLPASYVTAEGDVYRPM